VLMSVSMRMAVAVIVTVSMLVLMSVSMRMAVAVIVTVSMRVLVPMSVPVLMLMSVSMRMLVTMVVVVSMWVLVSMPVLMLMSVSMRMAVAVIVIVSMRVLVPVLMVMLVPMGMSMPMLMLMRMPMLMLMRMPMLVVMVMMVRMRGEGFLRQHRIFPLREKRIGGADHNAQHVRLVRQVAGACAVADRFDDDRGDAAREAVNDRSDNARSRWRRHLHAVVGRGDRQPAHHFQCGWGWHRINAVVDVDPARTQRYRRAIDALDIQRIDRQGDADHVNDRIDGADFVKMHPIDRDAMDLRFRDGDFFKNGKA